MQRVLVTFFQVNVYILPTETLNSLQMYTFLHTFASDFSKTGYKGNCAWLADQLISSTVQGFTEGSKSEPMCLLHMLHNGSITNLRKVSELSVAGDDVPWLLQNSSVDDHDVGELCCKPKLNCHATVKLQEQALWKNCNKTQIIKISLREEGKCNFSCSHKRTYHERQPTAGSATSKRKNTGQGSVWGQWGSAVQTDYCEAPEPAFHVWSHSNPYLGKGKSKRTFL